MTASEPARPCSSPSTEAAEEDSGGGSGAAAAPAPGVVPGSLPRLPARRCRVPGCASPAEEFKPYNARCRCAARRHSGRKTQPPKTRLL
jgi:hypothetical protein